MVNKSHIYNRLAIMLKSENLILFPDMSRYTSFRAGGHAEMLAVPQSIDELRHTLRVLSEENAEYMIMGNGTDILVKDEGYDGVIVKLGEAFAEINVPGNEGCMINAGGAALLSSVAKAALAAELTGFEFASGIPGSLGGAVFMNAGAYGGEMKDVVRSVNVISRNGKNERVLTPDQLDFAYRHSAIQSSGDIVTEVQLEFAKGRVDEIAEKMRELAAKRNEKQPVSLPSAGSFFKRPEGYFAGTLIQEAGLKGVSVGDAQVSPLHAGFIVNNGKATATDIILLMKLVQNTVYDKSGVWLEPEVRIIGR